MSTHFLRLIPTKPSLVLEAAAQQRAVLTLRSFLGRDVEITCSSSEEIEFIDQGEAFEEVRCPFCGDSLSDEWWSTSMDHAYQDKFRDLSVSLPCCDKVSSLNDLDYRGTAGFSRFVIEVKNPPSGDFLTAGQLKIVEDNIGCELRQIWSHY